MYLGFIVFLGSQDGLQLEHCDFKSGLQKKQV